MVPGDKVSRADELTNERSAHLIINMKKLNRQQFVFYFQYHIIQ